MTVKINAHKREASDTRNDLLHQGLIPAVCYGNNMKSISIVVPLIEFKKIWRESGESGTIQLNLDGNEYDTLIHEVQKDVVSNEPIHVDFLSIDTSKPVTVKVPIEFEGVSDAVKNGLGTLVKVMHEIEIEGLPKNLPHSISVDLALLRTLEDRITVGDVSFPNGVTTTTPQEEIIATTEKERSEEPQESNTADISDIEVEKKGKKETDSESA